MYNYIHIFAAPAIDTDAIVKLWSCFRSLRKIRWLKLLNEHCQNSKLPYPPRFPVWPLFFKHLIFRTRITSGWSSLSLTHVISRRVPLIWVIVRLQSKEAHKSINRVVFDITEMCNFLPQVKKEQSENNEILNVLQRKSASLFWIVLTISIQWRF